MATSKTVLKTYFETNDQPTQAQFSELVDAMRHVDESIVIRPAKGIQFKKTGNLNPLADETGDWRIRSGSGGKLVIEIYDGATWLVSSEFDAP